MAEVMEASRGGYYAWVKQGCICQSRRRDKEDLEIIRKAFERETRETYGPRSCRNICGSRGHPLDGFDGRLMREPQYCAQDGEEVYGHH
jgi:hypothetical protein